MDSPRPAFNRLTRREFIRLVGLGASATILTGCGLSPTATPQPVVALGASPVPSPTATTALAPAVVTRSPSPTGPAATPVAALATDPGLEVMLGQMLLVGFRGLSVDEQHPIVRDIRERHLGGVVLFSYDAPARSPVRNIQSPEQVRALSSALQSFAVTPLLITADQEGGRVARLSPDYGFPASPSHQTLGELGEEATAEAAAALAHTLARSGINLNLAPVVDLNANPGNPIIARYERSFGADAELVGRLAAAFIRAHHQAGVLCCLKHFPGHGSATADSHLGLVDVTATWTQDELLPYRALIGAGLADSIMTAHVFNAVLDTDNPATLSRPTIEGLLRNELDYDGVVISDDMQMGAIRSHYGFEDAVVAAIDAGVDILAIANNSIFEEDVVASTVQILQRAVAQGRITHERIAQSYRRIRQLKQRLA